MISKRDLQLGKLALRAGMVTKDQITRCLALKKKLFKEKGKKASLGALLIKKGWLTEAQLEELVRQHNEKFGDEAGAQSEAAASGEASAELAASGAGEASGEKKVKKKKKKRKASAGAGEASGETAVATEAAAPPGAAEPRRGSVVTRGGSSRRAREAAPADEPENGPRNGADSEEQVAEAQPKERSARVEAAEAPDARSASGKKKRRKKDEGRASRRSRKGDGSEDAGAVESAVESAPAPTTGSEVDPAVFQSAPEGAVDEEDRRLVACPECGKKYRIREQQQGKRFTCRRCKNKVKVPKDLFGRPVEAGKKKKDAVEVEEFSLGSSDQTSEPEAAGDERPKGSVRTAAARAAVAIQRVQQQQSIADLAKAAQQATKKGLPPRTKFGAAQAAMVFACFGLVAAIVFGGLYLSKLEEQREEEARRARAHDELAAFTRKVDEVLKQLAPALEKRQPTELSALLSDLQARIKERDALMRGNNRAEAEAWLKGKDIVGLQRSLHVARGEGLERQGTPTAAEEAVQAFGAAAELARDDEALQVLYARRLIRAGKNAEAAQRLERFASPAAVAVRGLAYERGGATPQALKAYGALKDGAATALLARAHLGERSLDRVVEVVGQAGSLTGADLAAAKVVLGLALDLRDDPNGARRALDEAAAAAPDSPCPRLALGEVLLRRGQAKEALQAFQAANGIVGTARGFLGLGDANAALLELDRARSAWKDATTAPLAHDEAAKLPGDVDPFEPSLGADPRALASCRLAALEAATGRGDVGARASYAAAQVADPFSIEAAAGLALLEIGAGKLAIADAYLLSALGRLRRMGGAEKETVRSASAATALLVRGAYFIEHGRYQDATEALATAVQCDPRVAPQAAALRGRLLELQSQHTRAYDAFAEAANLEAQAAASPAYAAAAALFEQSPDDAGAQEKVLAGVTAVLAQNPWHARAHLLRGRVLVRQRKAPQALPSLDRAIQLNTYLRDAYVQRGWVYARELPEAQQTRETSDKAFEDFQYALRIEQRQGGERAETHCGLAQVQYMKNNLDKAHESATKAIGIDAEHAEAYRLRALIRARQGEAKGAAEDQARHQQLTKK